jgi:hypothetical protein
MTTKQALKEGTIFTVPLEPRGYAVGVLARANGKGKAFGYFFAAIDDLSRLDWRESILVARFGDHGLYTGRWKVVGHLENWRRENWPIPNFMREHDDPKLVYLTRYNDSLDAVSEEIISADLSDRKRFPADAQYGSGVIEKLLSRFLIQ